MVLIPGPSDWVTGMPVEQTVVGDSVPPSISITLNDQSEAIQLERYGQELYQNHQYEAAFEAWQTVTKFYSSTHLLHQARLLSNLSLTAQQLGDWNQAQLLIDESLSLLGQADAVSYATPTRRHQGFAQSLNTQASLWFALGQTQDALRAWDQAIAHYHEANDDFGAIRAQINQAQAMQELGYHRQAIDLMTELVEQLDADYPDSSLQPSVLRQLGSTLRLVGQENESQRVLQEGLTIAQAQQNLAETSALLLSLGQTAQTQRDLNAALAFYDQALTYSVPIALENQIELAKVRTLLGLEEWQAAEKLWRRAITHASVLPHNRDTIYTYISLAQQLTTLIPHYRILPFSSLEGWSECIGLLTDAIQMAQDIHDHRAESYALGYLGHVYESTRQWSLAQQLTHQALLVAQQYKQEDIEYRWQWQSGRILKAEGEQEEAIAAYAEAVHHLSLLRGDLIATTSEEQFRFQEEVEPVYRELVGLLLRPDDKGQVSQAHLSQARDVMEAFQIAELDNFFQEACLDDSEFNTTQEDTDAAVIYPIILDNRFDVIMSVPNLPLQHYSTPIDQHTLDDFVNELRDNLVIRSRMNFLPQVKQLYDWMIRPMSDILEQSGVETLVFVLDGPLRQIPMGVLHDGEHYLLESYQITIAPGLTLLDPTPPKQQNWNAIIAGLSEGRHGFNPLSYVKVELNAIRQSLSGVVLLDETFTSKALQDSVQRKPFPLIHIASHGQFGSKPEDTFIVTWDEYLNIRQLQQILQNGLSSSAKNLELLVLSACETATGDPRAPLGLAGMAVRAGAKSTLATLWAVNDGVTAEFMNQFYGNLEANMTKAEALRQAQLWLLQSRRHEHPLYWAPYILIGNWK